MSTTTNASLQQRKEAATPRGVGVMCGFYIDRAKNAELWDIEGRRYIDFAGGIGVLNTGHLNDKVAAAVAAQAEKFSHTCYQVVPYELYVSVAEKLNAITPGDHAKKTAFFTTGAEAVENAIKVARAYTKRSGVIAFGGAFHGRTMMAMTLTSKVGYKMGCGPFAPEVYRLPYPDYYRYGKGMDINTFSDSYIRELEAFFHTNVPADQVAAIILEPVQGEGGFMPIPKKYLQSLREVCTKYGIMLILDEVQSGFGRTGKWAAYQHYDVVPDISTWAKSMGSGMPIGCVMGRAEIMDACKPSTIGGTYPGNPVCCAAAIATLDYMHAIDINALGEKVGNITRSRFQEMQSTYPCIGDVRGLGAMMAFELVKNNDPFQPDGELCKQLIAYCAAKGLVVISAGVNGNIIRVLSPLVIEETLLRKGLDIIENGLRELTQ